MHATTSPDHLLPKIGRKFQKAAQRKEKQEWALEKPKLDNARKLRGIFFFDPEDVECKRAEMLELLVEAAMPCKVKNYQYRGNIQRIRQPQIKACMHRGSSRIYERAFGKNCTETALQEREFNSYNVVHKFILNKE